MLTGVERATEIVRQTLDFVREGPPLLTRTSFLLAGLVDEAHAGLSGLALRNEVEPGLEVEADRVALFRVFSNLLANAQTAGATSAEVKARREISATVILVSDDGPGLPQGLQATLFRPFSSSGKPGGSGLGLAIVRDLMRAHGGDVILESTGVNGTVFRLTL